MTGRTLSGWVSNQVSRYSAFPGLLLVVHHPLMLREPLTVASITYWSVRSTQMHQNAKMRWRDWRVDERLKVR